MFTFSSSSFESVISDENNASGRIVYLDDVNVLKEFKSLLGRKKAAIEFEFDGDVIFCRYEYEYFRKTGETYFDKEGKEKEKREKTTNKGHVYLGKTFSAEDLDPEHFYHKWLNALWRFDPLCGGENILPKLVKETEVPSTKLELDVFQMDNVLFNKNDILRMLQVYKANITELYCEYDVAHGVAAFFTPEIDIDVYMTTVEKYED